MIKMKWGAERKFYLWIGVSLGLLVVIVASYYVTANRLITYDSRVKGSNEILLRLEEVFSSIKEMETSVRNYVITGKESYLSTTRGVRASINEGIGHVRKLLPDDSKPHQKLGVLESLISERLKLFDETTQLRENYGFEAAQQFIMTDKGERVSNEIREVIDEIEAEENRILSALLKDKQYARNMVFVTGFGIVVAILFAFLSIFTINRHITERKLLYENSRRQAEELRNLYEAQNQRSRDVEILNNVTQVIHESLDLDRVYDIALDSVMSFENVDMAMIYLIEENTNDAVVVAHRNVPESYLQKAGRIPYPKGITWKVIESAAIANIEDAQSNPHLGLAGRELAVQNALGIPLFQERKVIGVIWFLRYGGSFFDKREANLLSTLCNQIAVAIAKAKMYKALEDAHEKLMELDSQKDEFISIASHELRTPLGAVRGYLDMLLEGDFGVLPTKVVFAITEVNTATKRLMSLVNSMLDISRLEQGRLEFNISSFDLSNAYDEVIQSLAPVAQEKGIKLDYRPPDGAETPLVLADRDRVGEILFNLVGNAIKFTETDEVIITYRFDDTKIVTDVVDTGIGIPTQIRDRLFQKFWRGRKALTRSPQEGTGLGLYICRLLVREMGGEVWLERTELGEGSTFSFSLPRSERMTI